MVTQDRTCSRCKMPMLLDRVEGNNYYYTCTNPRCSEYKKAYTMSGQEKESTIKEHE